jgi:hypothetical protein
MVQKFTDQIFAMKNFTGGGEGLTSILFHVGMHLKIVADTLGVLKLGRSMCGTCTLSIREKAQRTCIYVTSPLASVFRSQCSC